MDRERIQRSNQGSIEAMPPCQSSRASDEKFSSSGEVWKAIHRSKSKLLLNVVFEQSIVVKEVPRYLGR